MSVLSNVDILRHIHAGELVIRPFDLQRFNPESVDLCLLGEYRILENLWAVEVVDLSVQFESFLGGSLRKHSCEKRLIRSRLVLRPGKVVVGFVKEYIKMPNNLCAIVDGKSHWAQLGLQVASAGLVHANWEGRLVLELVNLGNVPLVLHAGLPVCQISFFPLTSPAASPEELLAFWKGKDND